MKPFLSAFSATLGQARPAVLAGLANTGVFTGSLIWSATGSLSNTEPAHPQPFNPRRLRQDPVLPAELTFINLQTQKYC